MAIFERLPNELFQVFFQDFEKESHAYLKNCMLLLMVIFPVAESKEEQGRPWKVSAGVPCGSVLGWGSCLGGVRRPGARGVKMKACAERTFPRPARVEACAGP